MSKGKGTRQSVESQWVTEDSEEMKAFRARWDALEGRPFGELVLEADEIVTRARQVMFSQSSVRSAHALVRYIYSYFFSILPSVYIPCQTMFTDYTKIGIDPRFVLSIGGVRQVIFGLLHEILHCMYGHAGVEGRARCRIYGNLEDVAGQALLRLRNMAFDAVVNAVIIRDVVNDEGAQSIAAPIPWYVRYEGAENMSAEEVYLGMINKSAEYFMDMQKMEKPAEWPTTMFEAEKLFRAVMAPMQREMEELMKQMGDEMRPGQGGQGQGGQGGQGQGGQGGQGQGQGQDRDQGEGQGEKNAGENQGEGKKQDEAKGDSGKHNGTPGEKDAEASGASDGDPDAASEVRKKIDRGFKQLFGASDSMDNHRMSDEKTKEAVDRARDEGRESPVEGMEKQVLSAAKDMESMGMGIGSVSAIGRFLTKVLEAYKNKGAPQWLRIFNDIVGSVKVEKDRMNWTRPHRKTDVWQMAVGEDFILPTLQRYMVHMVFVVDVSGSIGQGELSRGLAEILRAAEAMGDGNRLTLLQVDTETLRRDGPIEIGTGEYDDMKKSWLTKGFERAGCGGTLFGKTFEDIANMDDKPDAVVVITDMGIGDLDSLRKPDARVAWIVNPEYESLKDRMVPPFGELAVMDQLGKELDGKQRLEPDLGR